MDHKEEVKFNRLQLKLESEMKIVEAIAKGRVEWGDGTGKKNIVLRVFCEDREEALVRTTKNYIHNTYYITISGWKMKMKISDHELKDILDEGVKKVKEAKAKAKQEADEAKQKKSKIGYMDVFKRVADFLKKNGYSITTPKDEQEQIVMKVGTVVLHWHNVKDFVSAGFDAYANWDRDGYISIFKVISYWESKYYKLMYPSLRKLVDKVGVLGKVKKDAILPVNVMKELNRLKI